MASANEKFKNIIFPNSGKVVLFPTFLQNVTSAVVKRTQKLVNESGIKTFLEEVPYIQVTNQYSFQEVSLPLIVIGVNPRNVGFVDISKGIFLFEEENHPDWEIELWLSGDINWNIYARNLKELDVLTDAFLGVLTMFLLESLAFDDLNIVNSFSVSGLSERAVSSNVKGFMRTVSSSFTYEGTALLKTYNPVVEFIREEAISE